MDKSDIEKLAAWGPQKEVNTKVGPRLVSKAKALPAGFWDLWNAHKPDLKALGVSVSKNLANQWELCWWQEITDEVKAARAQAVEMSKASSADVELPCPDGYDYMPFQKAGILYALPRPGVLIGDDMGLGKTVQAIGILNCDKTIKTALVICPKSVKLNWQRECDRWLVEDGRGLVAGVVGTQWPSASVVIINYEALAKWQEVIKSIEWDAVICDEAHLLKNRKTQRSKLAKGIKSRRKIRLTGTPIVNRPIELYNIIEDLGGGFGSFFEFARRYAGGVRTRFGWDFLGATNLDELQRKLREQIMVRRLKSEVLTELPRKIRQVIELEPDASISNYALRAERAYEEQSDTRLAELRAAVELSKAESEQAFQVAVENLRKANQVDFEEMARLRHETALAKLPQVIAHIEDALEDNDSKIVVAAHHRDVIEQIVEAAAQKGWNPVHIVGGMAEQDRQNAVDRFQNDPSCRVFVASILAAGVGITLTAASLMVFAELTWVPGEISQMEDREHRIGQNETVLIQHLVLAGSLDARMAHILISKQRIIDQALDVNHPERTAPVFEAKEKPATVALDVRQVQDEAVQISSEEAEEVLSALRFLASLDADRASGLNGVGFSKIDTAIGHSLAEQNHLTPKQAVLGKRLVKKYHRQLEMNLGS